MFSESSNALEAMTSETESFPLRSILAFLDADARFQMRVLNRRFYKAYFDVHTTYESEVQVSARRVLALTERGCVFRNVMHLNIEEGDLKTEPGPRENCPHCTQEPIASLHCQCGTVRVGRLHLGQATGLPNLQSLFSATGANILLAFAGRESITRIGLAWQADVQTITDQTFPNLRFLQVPYLSIIRLEQHCNIEEIRACGLDDTDLAEVGGQELGRISRANFPKLRRLIAAMDGREEAMTWGFISVITRLYHIVRVQQSGIRVHKETAPDSPSNGWFGKTEILIPGESKGWRRKPQPLGALTCSNSPIM